jgi:arginase
LKIQIIAVPYDSGRRGFRMGRGPEHLLQSGLVTEIEKSGHEVSVQILESSGDDVACAFDLARQIALLTSAADAADEFTIILGGNCVATLGGYAGLQSRTAMLWLDAHADLNTPETSESGFLDGMALSIITGRCHAEQAAQLPGFRPLSNDRLLMLGMRSVDEGEKNALERTRFIRDARDVQRSLDDLDVNELYLHVDLDVVDSEVARANHFAEPHGLSREDLLKVIATAIRCKRVRAAALTAYDPDTDERALGLAKEIVHAFTAEQIR